MDPTDARRLVRDLCRRAGVDPDAVLGRDRTARVIAVRRGCIRELRRRGLSFAKVGEVVGRDRRTVWRIESARVASEAVGPSR